MLLMDAEISVVDKSVLEMIVGMAEDSTNKRARACMAHTDAAVQEMVIALLYGSYIRPHRHPRHKCESYHVIEGELLVRIFTPDGQLHREILLNKKTPFYRMKGGWYHQPVPQSPVVIYHETYQGPFIKEQDVEYASWADAEPG